MFGNEVIPKSHIRAKARLLSEGVRLPQHEEAPSPPASGPPEAVDVNDVEDVLRQYATTLQTRERTPIKELGNVLRFDGSGVTAPIIPSADSRLELEVEGARVTVSDGDQVVVTGCISETPAWAKETLSNGLPVTSVLPIMSEGIINVLFSLSCFNYNSRQGCKYCNLFANSVAKQLTMLPLETLAGYAKYQAEAVKIATDAGWRGALSFSAGALPPAQRASCVERIAVVMEALRGALDEETFASLPKILNHYPPEDFSEMHEWKALGITATCIDLEVMDPAYFAAICPGKHRYKPLEYWKRAQEASVEVFGPYVNTTSFVIVGLEPMASLIKGVQERLKKGVLPLPFVFYSAPGSPYWGFRPPTADWLMESVEQLADAVMPHAPRILQSLAKPGARAPAAPSFANCMLFDEMQRRFRNLMAGLPGEASAEREPVDAQVAG